MDARLGPGRGGVKTAPSERHGRFAADVITSAFAFISLFALGAPVVRAASPPPDEIVGIRIQGNEHVPAGDIRRVMKLQTSSFLHSRAYEADVLQEDLVAIRALHVTRGYLDAQVEGRAVVVNARTLPHQVVIEIQIHEGGLTVVTETTFEGNTVFSTSRLLEAVHLKPPAPYDTLEVEPDLYRIQTLYLDEGYLQIHVEPSITRTPGARAIHYRLQEGRQYHVGDVRIEGNRRTRGGVIRREVKLETGDIFRRRKVMESEQNVYGMGLFSRVDLVPQPPTGTADTLDLIVRVAERKTRWLGFGVGYGTIDELRLSGEWGNRNLWGTSRRLNVKALYATQIYPPKMQRVRLEAGFGEPRIIGSKSLLSVNPFFERRLEDYLVSSVRVGEYQIRTVGVGATLAREFGRGERWWLGVNQNWIKLSDPTFVPTEADLEALGVDNGLGGQEASIVTGYERDTRDDFLNPRRGSLVRLQAELSAARPLGLDNPFLKLTATNGRHQPSGSEGALTTRLSVGAILRVGDSPIPDRERFKIGGESTLRGYEDRVIGPGNYMLTGSVEYLFPLPGSPRGFVFFDGGGVWERIEDIKLSQFFDFDGTGKVRYTAGPGLWIPTPVGPLKVGYGQRIGDHPIQASGRFFILFGEAF